MILLLFGLALGASIALGVALRRGRHARQETVRVGDQIWTYCAASVTRERVLGDHLSGEVGYSDPSIAIPDTPTGRSLQLLLSYLTPAQVTTFWLTHYIDVQSQYGAPYRIHCDRDTFNVERRSAVMACFYCIQVDPRYAVPYYDGILAQMMLLRTNEIEFLRIANRGFESRVTYSLINL